MAKVATEKYQLKIKCLGQLLRFFVINCLSQLNREIEFDDRSKSC